MQKSILGIIAIMILDGLLTNYFVYDPSEITKDIKHLSIYEGTADLWLFWLTRQILLFIWIPLVCLRISTNCIKFVSGAHDLCAVYYLAAKLLVFKDEHVWDTSNAICWSVFFICILGSAGSHFLLGKRLSRDYQSLGEESEEATETSENEATRSDENNNEVTQPSENNSDEVIDDADYENPNQSMSAALLKFAAPEWWIFLLAVFFLIIASVAASYTPLLIGQIVEELSKGNTEALGPIILELLVMMAVLMVASGLRGCLMSVVQAKVTYRMRLKLFEKILDQEVGFFDKSETGKLVSMISTDCQTVCTQLGLNINVLIRSTITIGVNLFFMNRVSWRLTLISVSTIPFLAVCSKYLANIAENLQEKTQSLIGDGAKISTEVFGSIRTVLSFSAVHYETQRFTKVLDEIFLVDIKTGLLIIVQWCIWIASATAIPMFTVLYVWKFGKHGVGDLFSFILLQQQLEDNLSTIAWVFTGIFQAFGASKKVFKTLDRITKRAVPQFLPDLEKLDESTTHDITFKNVHFSYPNRTEKKILNDFNLTIPAGKVTALVGSSGGGKSTVLALLQNHYKATDGGIYVGDVGIEEFNTYSEISKENVYGNMITIVNQEPVLFPSSISENVKYNNEDFKSHQVVEACRLSNASNFIEEMPKKYDTLCGESGTQLSGGQKQRVAIARALIRSPKILLLDEATSALDSESEHLVQKAIDANLSDKTVIVIAHRLSTIEKADKIVVIHEGRVVETGTHQQLMKRELPKSDSQDGQETGSVCYYRQLVNRQLNKE